MISVPHSSLLAALLCCRLIGHAQVIVWPGGDPGQMALTHLQGANVTITSAFSQTTDWNQAAIFVDSTASIGLDTGIVICTGLAQVVVGPNTLPNATFGGEFYTTDIDIAIMTPLYPGTMADAGIIQMDLVPWGDTLTIRYVFASEEYDEYACSDKDDRLGMFLSGPGLAGPFMNSAVNIARLPISNLPVSVNTLNRGIPGSNGNLPTCNMSPGWEQDTIYYINNDVGLGTQMDGYSVVLTARSVVQPGATYHLKIAIADINDANFDSAVFLPVGAISCSDISTGIEGLGDARQQDIWLNSVDREIMVRGLAAEGGSVQLEVFDPTGRLLQHGQAVSAGGIARLALEPAITGMVILRAMHAGRLATARVLVP